MKQRILLTGKDGIDLLQRITTLDFSRIPEGLLQAGLILNPQGKILSYFEAKKTGTRDQLEIQFHETFMGLLDQYTFGERYQIETLEVAENSADSATELLRIQSRTPRLGNEFLENGETNPLEVHLDSAIHDQKGCYPGQEVIEKIIAIGSPSKKLCLVKSDDPSKSIHLPLDLDFGKLTSYQSGYGLAIVRKTHTAIGTKLTGAGLTFEVLES